MSHLLELLLREPVRAAFGTLLVAVLALLVALEVIDDGTSLAIGGVATGVGLVLTELARAKVTPLARTGPVLEGGHGPAPGVYGDRGAGELRLALAIAGGILIALIVWALLGDSARE